MDLGPANAKDRSRPDRYAEEVGSPTAQSSAGPPPIVDATVNEDGSVDRIAVRLADPDDPRLVPAESDGYALDFDYSTAATVDVADVSDRTGIAWDRLPQQPSDVPLSGRTVTERHRRPLGPRRLQPLQSVAANAQPLRRLDLFQTTVGNIAWADIRVRTGQG